MTREAPSSRAKGIPETTAILGLGLMGGSLARDLAARGGRVLAFDTRADVVENAAQAGVVEKGVGPALTELAIADLVVLAVPVDQAVELMERVAGAVSAAAVVTDVGSTKRAIVERAEQVGLGTRFVGSHPLAGDHRSGWAAAHEGLYDGVRVFLCPTRASTAAAQDHVRHLWEAVGGRCRVLDADEHDREMAWISHLPQVTSSALAAALAAGKQEPADLGPGGRDMTRLAGSSPEMWSAICLQNGDLLHEALRELRQQLETFDRALEARDTRALLEFFRSARNWAE